MLSKFITLYICFTTVFAQKLPTAFTGVVQVEKVAKKGEESETAPHSPLLQGCFDQHECCQVLRSMGQCIHFQSDMKLWCPATCGYCQPSYSDQSECVDLYNDCPRLARADYCSSFEYFMSQNCRNTCHKCGRTREESCKGSQMDCSKAPTESIRKVCEQPQKWDVGSRKSTILGSEIALPPGATSAAEIWN